MRLPWGTASFALNIGGRTCTLQRTVVALSGCGAFVASGVWKEFQCHNLGANTSAAPFTPSWELNGNYYQWGRRPTCFGRDGVDGSNPCSSPVYGAAAPWGSTTSNDNAGAITGWSTTAASNTAWSDGSRTSSDPCPTGFKVPSAAQWEGVINASLNPRLNIGTWSSTTTNYSSGVLFGTLLFMPAAGSRDDTNGALLGNRGLWGDYWSSSIDTATGVSRYMALGNNSFSMTSTSRTGGLSVRCVAL